MQRAAERLIAQGFLHEASLLPTVISKVISPDDTDLQVDIKDRLYHQMSKCDGSHIASSDNPCRNELDFSINRWIALERIRWLENEDNRWELFLASRGIQRAYELDLEELNLSYLNLRIMPIEVLRLLPHLKRVNLSHNNIEEIPQIGSALPITDLDLQDNAIKEIDCSRLNPFTKLQSC
jgi:Leucine-rich repeat (LRR) protein